MDDKNKIYLAKQINRQLRKIEDSMQTIRILMEVAGISELDDLEIESGIQSICVIDGGLLSDSEQLDVASSGMHHNAACADCLSPIWSGTVFLFVNDVDWMNNTETVCEDCAAKRPSRKSETEALQAMFAEDEREEILF